ncbi:hypothetical protein EGW08_022914, partial [Elysia chlorotica]
MLKRQTRYSKAIVTQNPNDSSVYLDVNSPTDTKISMTTSSNLSVSGGDCNSQPIEGSRIKTVPKQATKKGPISIPLVVLQADNVPKSLHSSKTSPPSERHTSRGCGPPTTAGARQQPGPRPAASDNTNTSAMPRRIAREEPPEGKPSSMLLQTLFPSAKQSRSSNMRVQNRASSTGPPKVGVTEFKFLPTSGQGRQERNPLGGGRKASFKVWASESIPPGSEKEVMRASTASIKKPQVKSVGVNRFSVVPLDKVQGKASSAAP